MCYRALLQSSKKVVWSGKQGSASPAKESPGSDFDIAVQLKAAEKLAAERTDRVRSLEMLLGAQSEGGMDLLKRWGGLSTSRGGDAADVAAGQARPVLASHLRSSLATTTSPSTPQGQQARGSTRGGGEARATSSSRSFGASRLAASDGYHFGVPFSQREIPDLVGNGAYTSSVRGTPERANGAGYEFVSPIKGLGWVSGRKASSLVPPEVGRSLSTGRIQQTGAAFEWELSASDVSERAAKS